VKRLQNRTILRAETGVYVPQRQSLSGAAFVAIMQPTDLWEGNNSASGRWAYGVWPKN
jgi:hypothetical protein